MAEPIADVCLVGTGAVGEILAKELGSAGLKVIAFERGASLTLEDYAVRDAIRFITVPRSRTGRDMIRSRFAISPASAPYRASPPSTLSPARCCIGPVKRRVSCREISKSSPGKSTAA